MKTIVRILIALTLALGLSATVPTVSVGTVEDTVVPIVSCESTPAADTGDTSIGTALTLERTADVDAAVDACDGTATVLP